MTDGGLVRREQVSVRLAATPASVGVVRRVVDDVLHAWGHEQLVDDVTLCVTELSTHSTLHGASHVEVEVALLDSGVRVVVLDDGTTPASAIATRVSVSGLDALDTDIESPGMTGRGLFIVSSLAADWGIEDVERGVRIWALFRPEAVMAALRQPQVTPAVRAVRDWIAEQQLAQAGDGEAPTSFPAWLAPAAARLARS